MDEQLQDEAAEYAMGQLSPEEASAFEARLRDEPELQRLVDELRETVATLAYAAPVRPLPGGLEQRVMAAIREEESPPRPMPARSWLPWAIAASLAFFCGILAWDRAQLARTVADLNRNRAAEENNVAALTSQRDQATQNANQTGAASAGAQATIVRLKQEREALAKKVAQLEEQAEDLRVRAAKLTADRDSLNQRVSELENTAPPNPNVQVTTLVSKMNVAPQARATVSWDATKQEGTLRLFDVPPAGAGRDYQLWAIDPQYRNPVSAGVFNVESQGVSEIVFRPTARVAATSAFAVSLEQKGGVTKAQGPMVLVSR
jgi:anti-sigma-K factor RskA